MEERTDEEEVKLFIQRFLSNNMQMSMEAVVRLKNGLNDLANRLGIPPFYVYYTVDKIYCGSINVTQSYDEFIGVKYHCEFEQKLFVGA